MDAPPLKDTDIEGDLMAMMQTLSAILRKMPADQGAGVTLLLEEVLKKSKAMVGQDIRFDAVLQRMNESLAILGRDALQAARRDGVSPASKGH